MRWESDLKARFEEHWERVKDTGAKIVNARNQFVMSCLEVETDEFRANVERQVKEEHEAALEAWEEGTQVQQSVEGYQRYETVSQFAVESIS